MRIALSKARWIVLGMALSGCGGEPAPSPDLLLVSIDTLRGDRWGCLGDPRARTPHADRLARGGILAFEGRAPVPVTLPSHASLLTGLPPVVHGVRDNGIFRLPDDQGTTVAEALRERGYRTAAVVSAYPLMSRFGLARGFDVYNDRLGNDSEKPGHLRESTAPETVARVRRWLSGTRGPAPDEPAFLWVHFFDPHADYAAGEPWDSVWPDDPYRAEVALVDLHLGALLRLWRESRPRSRPEILITSDHGEGLGDHGESTHGVLVQTSTLRVPIVHHRPGFRPALLAHPVGIERIAATLLECAGISGPLNPGAAPPLTAPAGPVLGESLYPHFNFGWRGLRVREDREWRLVAGATDRLYRLAADPGETRDLASENPEVARRLREDLETEWRRRSAGAFRSQSRTLTAEEEEALRSLGYAAGGGEKSAESGFESGPDPYSRVALADRINEGISRFGSGDAEGSRRILASVVVEDPGNRLALEYLGRAAVAARRLPEARDAFRRALALGPNPVDVYLDLAYVEQQLGETEAEGATLKAALASDPRSIQVRHRLADWYLRAGRGEEAVELLREALRHRPRSAETHLYLGKVLESLGRTEEAMTHWRRVVELDGEGREARLARRALERYAAGASR